MEKRSCCLWRFAKSLKDLLTPRSLFPTPAPSQAERADGTHTKGKKWGSIRHGYGCDHAGLAGGVSDSGNRTCTDPALPVGLSAGGGLAGRHNKSQGVYSGLDGVGVVGKVYFIRLKLRCSVVKQTQLEGIAATSGAGGGERAKKTGGINCQTIGYKFGECGLYKKFTAMVSVQLEEQGWVAV
jgi:hypothetical protein